MKIKKERNMEKEKERRIAIVKCRSYNQKEVDRAIKKALKLLEFDKKKYKKILIKPNIVGGYGENQEAITTHPSLVRAVIKELDGKKFIGESSFSDTENSLKKAGYSDFKNIVIFENSKLVKIHNAHGKILKSFYISKKVRNSDLVVNMPKLKTHTLTKMTGAIKNLYGCISGGMKQVFHKKARGDERFSNLLVDIYQSIKPELNIMDAVISMEGEGPSAGKPKKVGLILASRNAVALDIACARLMGYKSEEILAVKEAVERGLYPNYKVEVVGELKEIPNLKFIRPTMQKKRFLKGLLVRLVREDPIVVDKEKCTKCRKCWKICPMKAIEMKPYPFIDKKKCIRCFCCIEVCPQHALHLQETLARKIYKMMKERRRKK